MRRRVLLIGVLWLGLTGCATTTPWDRLERWEEQTRAWDQNKAAYEQEALMVYGAIPPLEGAARQRAEADLEAWRTRLLRQARWLLREREAIRQAAAEQAEAQQRWLGAAILFQSLSRASEGLTTSPSAPSRPLMCTSTYGRITDVHCR